MPALVMQSFADFTNLSRILSQSYRVLGQSGMLMFTQFLAEKVVLYWASNSRALMTNDNRALALIEAGELALLRRPVVN